MINLNSLHSISKEYNDAFCHQSCCIVVTLAPVSRLTSSEGESLAGQRAAGIVDRHHPHLVGLVRLQLLQDTITLLHCHTVLL